MSIKNEIFLRSKFNCFLMLTYEQVGILLTIVFAAIVVLALIIERLLNWHASRIISIQKRSDEFITLSKKYYLLLANLTGRIQAETDLKLKPRLEILFFKIAKYLSFYYSFSDDAGAVWIFPKETHEEKVNNCSMKFYAVLLHDIFLDNWEAIERVIKYYKSYSDVLNFVEDIEKFPEYQTFKIIYDDNITEKLFKTSRDLREAILEGITEEYKVWHKFELKKFFGMLKEKTYIDKIVNKIYKNKK